MQIYEVFQESAVKGMQTVPAAPVKYQPLQKSIVNRMSQAMGGGPLYKDPFERPEEPALQPATQPEQEPEQAKVDYNVPAYIRKGIPNPADAATAAPTAPTTAAANTAPAPVPPTKAPAATEPSPAQSAVGVKQINQLIPKIRTRDLTSIKKNIDAVLTKRQSKVAAPSAMSSMASQLTSKPIKTSTGGSLQQTPTGSIHTAKPAAKTAVAPAKKTVSKKTPAKKPTWTGRKQKVSTPPPSGAPTADEYANFEKKVQQALAAQGKQA